jgi:phage tail sheath protein FI
MAFQVSPGVEVKEIDLTNIVPAVSTTNAGFAGFFEWGPVDQKVTVTSIDDLRETFAGPTTANANFWFTAANYLSYASNLKIVRVQDGALNSGNSGGVLIKNVADYNTKTATTQADFVGNNVIGKFPGGDAATDTSDGIVSGNSLLVSFTNRTSFTCGSLTAASFGLAAGQTKDIRIKHDIDFRVVGNTAGGSNGLYADRLVLGGVKYPIVGASAEIVGGSGGSIIDIAAPGLLTQSVGPTVGSVEWKYADNVDTVTPATSSFAEQLGATNDIVQYVVIDQDGDWTGTPGSILEAFDNMSQGINAKDDEGRSSYFRNVLRDNSEYIYAGAQVLVGLLGKGSGLGDRNIASGITFGLLQENQYLNLKGGTSAAEPSDFITDGYDKFSDAETDDTSLLLGGPSTATTAQNLVTQCNNRKDCITFLSPPKDAVLSSTDVPKKNYIQSANVVAYRRGLDGREIGGDVNYGTSNLNVSSSFAFLDSGWKYIFDRFNDVFRYVPLNGDIAGIAARSDITSETWFSPAGFNRGQLNNVVSLAFNPNKASRDELYKNGINPVVSFPGQGTVLFGDKTLLSKPSAFDRINVRRLFIVLEKAIATAAKFQLFELNDRFTRAQFKNLIEPFLLDVQARRGITDFKVVCDESNNTPAVIDRNAFVADIFVQPTRSINFITLNFIATRTGVDFNEIQSLGGSN